MMKYLFSRRSLVLSGAIAAVTTGLAAAPAWAGTAQSGNMNCSAPTLTQPYLSAGDSNWYTLMGGQATDDFNGGGWTLTGGAKIVSTRLADGQTGHVLDLPSGATAVSPTMCVDYTYQTARINVRNVVGKAGVNVAVAYTATRAKRAVSGTVSGSGSGWALSNPVNVLPANTNGQQHVTFTLTGGSGGESQLSNFWVDPRMR